MNLKAFKKALAKPIDIAGLVYFRIGFGIIMLIEVIRFFNHNWIKRYYIDPQFYFYYDGFSWLSPWSGDGMYYHFYALGILAFFIAIGFLYRISMVLFWLGFSFVFLLDKTNYLNHFYLISLLSFVMIFLPANRAFSIDALLFPKLRANYVPNWTLWVLRLKLGIAYFYGGIAKINSDWLQGEPMRKWLSSRTEFPLIGRWFNEEWMVYMFTYGGMLLDLFIFPLLVFRKTRVFGAIVITSFHLMNHELFTIGIFPWFMMAATAIFFPPEKLRLWKKYDLKKPESFTVSKWVLWGFGIYFFIQITVPFRHFLYGRNPSWTNEGHRFAWHMKLHSKSAEVMFFIISQDTDDIIAVELSDYLTKRQIRKIKTKPDMIWQFAQFLAEEEAKKGNENVEIYVDAKCGLNGRPKERLISANVDLTKISYPFYAKADWILPLTKPLK